MQYYYIRFRGRGFYQTLIRGCPETSPGDEALAVKIARHTTHKQKTRNMNNIDLKLTKRNIAFLTMTCHIHTTVRATTKSQTR